MSLKTFIAGAGMAACLATGPATAQTSAPAANPLLAPWSGPYGGVPPFDQALPAPALKSCATAGSFKAIPPNRWAMRKQG